MKKQIVIKINKPYKLLLFLVTILLVMSIFTLNIFSKNVTPEPSFNTYTVRTGDTLWDIAKEAQPNDSMDIREVLYEIKKVNDINNEYIVPGQVLTIPNLF